MTDVIQIPTIQQIYMKNAKCQILETADQCCYPPGQGPLPKKEDNVFMGPLEFKSHIFLKRLFKFAQFYNESWLF